MRKPSPRETIDINGLQLRSYKTLTCHHLIYKGCGAESDTEIASLSYKYQDARPVENCMARNAYLLQIEMATETK